jgi:hypothetical protein
MNRALSILLVIAITAVVVPIARSVGTPTPPPGISQSDWIPLGDAAGFVIAAAAAPNTVKGYFMARREGAWVRVDSSPDYETHPADCPNARRSPVYGL